MFKEGENFYVGDYKTGRIYKVAIKDFSVTEVYAIPGFEQSNYKLANIAWDGETMWACAEGVGKIFRISLRSLKPIKF
jgi:hypothetical protein